MKKVIAALLATALIVVALPVRTEAIANGYHIFEDTGYVNENHEACDHWARFVISWGYEEGILKGTSETLFSPDASLSRAMAVTILYRLSGEKESSTSVPFTDVPEDAYYTEAVAWASEHAIAEGIAEGLFAPDADILRQDFITMLHRYNRMRGLYEKADGKGAEFPDAGQINAYAAEAMAWAAEKKVIVGDDQGQIHPQRAVTRAEAAAMLFNYDSIDHANLINLDAANIDYIFLRSTDGPYAILTMDHDAEDILAIVDSLNRFDYDSKHGISIIGAGQGLAVYEKGKTEPVLSICVSENFISSGTIHYRSICENFINLERIDEIIDAYSKA